MSDGVLRQIDADMTTIPPISGKGDSSRVKVMKTLAHAYLRLWTRLALASGQRLELSPNQFELGTYDGQMKWSLNESVDFKDVSQLLMGASFKKRHDLTAETYVQKGDERVRIFFALEEERIRDRPVFVNYLVYDVPIKEFSLAEVIQNLKGVVPQWLETITSADDAPLWDVCRAKLECVGI